MAAALQRGLSLSDFEDMDIGGIVDYVVTYNNAYFTDEDNSNTNKSVRKATQEDFDNF